MNKPRKLQVRFWGVRGSIPTPLAHNLGYGGNTACIEVRYEAEPPLIFDAVGPEPEFASPAAIWRSGFPEALESRARNSRRRL